MKALRYSFVGGVLGCVLCGAWRARVVCFGWSRFSYMFELPTALSERSHIYRVSAHNKVLERECAISQQVH